MKNSSLAVLALLATGTAHADKTYTLNRQGWELYQSGTLQSAGWPDEQSCVAGALARVTAVGTNTQYHCQQRTNLAITVTSTAAPSINLTATPQSISSGGASTLNWSSANTTSCTASGGWSGSRATSGTQPTGPLTVGTAYNLTCNGSGGTANAAVTVAVTAASGSVQYGLEWPGTGAVRRMLLWPNPMPMYDATYIFRVYPKGPKNNGAGGNYWTTFFWGNNGAFSWGSGACDSFYGAHPYPFGGNGSATGQNWELSANCNDYSFVQPNGSAQVQWNRWFTQAFRAFKDTASNTWVQEFYFDLPDTSKVIRYTTWTNQMPKTPPSPAIMMGQSANVNGASWGGYPGWEEFKGIIRGLQFYNGALSVADILNEVTLPQSTANGNAKAWYINLNPRPSDTTDKKVGGTPHNPTWDGTTALEWMQ